MQSYEDTALNKLEKKHSPKVWGHVPRAPPLWLVFVKSYNKTVGLHGYIARSLKHGQKRDILTEKRDRKALEKLDFPPESCNVDIITSACHVWGIGLPKNRFLWTTSEIVHVCMNTGLRKEIAQ